MAIYHQDIADIELNSGSLHRSFLNHSIGLGDAAANRFGVRIFRDGAAETLSGVTCQGFFRNANGQNIALTSYGTISGNVAYVTLPQACYNVEGVFTLAIKLVGGGVTGTMRIIDGMVDNTNTGSAVAPTGSVPTYQEVLSVYEQMQAALSNYDAKVTEQDGKIDSLKSAIVYSNDKICAIESDLHGEYNVYPNYQQGRYIQNGYAPNNKEYINSILQLEAGTYSFINNMGSGYQYGLFQYVSDTSANIVQDLNTISRENLSVPDGTKITVRKVGSTFNTDDVDHVYRTLQIIKKNTNTENVDALIGGLDTRITANKVTNDYNESILYNVCEQVNGETRHGWRNNSAFEASGYVNTLQWICSYVLDSGVYSFVVPSGYRYEIYYYNSDTSGTLVTGPVTTNKTYSLSNSFVVSVAKAAGGTLTDDEKLIIKRQFAITSHTGNIINKIALLQNHASVLDSVILANKKPMASDDDIVNVQWSRGSFDANGYNNSGAWQNSGVLSAGKYTIYIPSGVRYEIYTHNSDASGTIVVSSTTTSGVTYNLASDFVVSVGTQDGTQFDISNIDLILSKIIIIRSNSVIPNGPDMVDIYNANVRWPLGSGEKVFAHEIGSALYKVVNGNTNFGRIRFTLKDGLDPVGINYFDVCVYIKNASEITSFTLDFVGVSAVLSNSQITDGWNNLRFYVYRGNLATYNTITDIMITANGNSGTEWYLKSISYVRKDKGWILFIEDGGYTTFFANGYQDLIDLGVPVTLAYDCGTPGKDAGSGRGRLLTVEEVVTEYEKGYLELSYHAWDSNSPSAQMTAQQVRVETDKCLRMLQLNGLLPAHPWRAAHTQNSAVNGLAQKGMVEALATWSNGAFRFNSFPFADKWNVDRVALHGQTNAYIDALFDGIQKTHCGTVIYTHGITTASDYDVTPTAWAYFISKLSAAIQSGWMIGVTYNDLANGILD